MGGKGGHRGQVTEYAVPGTCHLAIGFHTRHVDLIDEAHGGRLVGIPGACVEKRREWQVGTIT